MGIGWKGKYGDRGERKPWKRVEGKLWGLGEEEIMGIWVRGSFGIGVRQITGNKGVRKLWGWR